jgi:hypothetical protein
MLLFEILVENLLGEKRLFPAYAISVKAVAIIIMPKPIAPP